MSHVCIQTKNKGNKYLGQVFKKCPWGALQSDAKYLNCIYCMNDFLGMLSCKQNHSATAIMKNQTRANDIPALREFGHEIGAMG